MQPDADSRELLVKIDVKLAGLIEKFDAASQGDGFTRCVNRAERIKRLEQDVIALKKDKADQDAVDQVVKDVAEMKKRKTDFDTWLMRLTWAVIICGIVKMAFFSGAK